MLGKQILGSMLIGLFTCCSCVNAQIVTVDGVGTDKNSAVRDAMRNAVEEVTGTYINSKTLVSNAEVKLDEILTGSQGFVTKVDVLDSSQQGQMYRVKCRIDVNDNPNSALMDRLNIIMMLNDPRIATVISCPSGVLGARTTWKQMAEGRINTELLNMGFNHVVDGKKIVDGRNVLRLPNPEVDYVVLGELHFKTGEIVLPEFYVAGKQDYGFPSAQTKTDLSKSVAILNVRIIKADNQELISQFDLTETKLADSDHNAEQLVIDSLSRQTAARVAEAFAKKAAKVNNSRQIVARASSYEGIIKLKKALSNLPSVDSVQERGYTGGKGTLDVVSSQSLNTLYRMLREDRSLGLFLENMSENVLEISVN